MKFSMTLRSDKAPAGTQARLHIALLLVRIQPFFSRQLYRVALVREKKPPFLFLFGAMGHTAAWWVFFLERLIHTKKK